METEHDRLWSALIEAGLIPASCKTGTIIDPSEMGNNLFPSLIRMSSQHGRENEAPRADRQLLDWMIDQHGRGAQLTFGVPIGDSKTNLNWLGRRLCFVTAPIPQKTFVGLISSRLSQDLEMHRDWFRLLRTLCAGAERRDEVLVVAESTTVSRFITRAARLFGTPILTIKCPEDDSRSIDDWLRSLQEIEPQPIDSAIELHLSPRLVSFADSADDQIGRDTAPLRDRAAIALSDRVHVLRLRRGGHIDRLVRRRLDDRSWPMSSIQIARGPGCVADDLADELQGTGAVGWVLLANEDLRAQPEADSVDRIDCSANKNGIASLKYPADSSVIECPTSSIIDESDFESAAFLTHCTRRRIGPWPDQSQDEYLDDLILDRPSADHSPFAALMRIVKQQRLIASGRLIRGSFPVVSFTAVPLGQIPQLRTFRPHLSRWDFEPYGICLKREWLDTLGAKPVAYGNEQIWQALSDEQRPYFQLLDSDVSTESASIDWSIEREWRHQGDIPLSTLSSASAFLFVPTIEEARELEEVSLWPIIILPQNR